MRIFCWMRELWFRYWYPNGYPISGHTGIEMENGEIVCERCGVMLYDPAKDSDR